MVDLDGFPASIANGEIRVEVYDNLKYPEFGRLYTERVVTIPSDDLHAWSLLADGAQLLVTYRHLYPTGGGVASTEVGEYRVPEGTKEVFVSYAFGMDDLIPFHGSGDDRASELHASKQGVFPFRQGLGRAHNLYHQPLGLDWGQLCKAADVLAIHGRLVGRKGIPADLSEGKVLKSGWAAGEGGAEVYRGYHDVVSGRLVYPNNLPGRSPYLVLKFDQPHIIWCPEINWK